MHRDPRRTQPWLPALGAGVVLPVLFALAGVTATAPLQGVSAQESDVGQSEGRRRGRSGRRDRTTERTPATPPGMQQAAPLATFGDWNVFTAGQGRTKVCYVIAQPQTRNPKTLARDTAYLFVTVRKADNLPNEIALMFGFKPKLAASQVKPGASAAPSDPYLQVGATRYGLVVKDENAWVQNQAEEARIVTEMSKVQSATVRTTSMRGNPTTDEYALGGFADAFKRTREECK